MATGIVAERFVLDTVAGSGGAGTVYRARDLVTGGLVALKIVEAPDDQEDRFLREAKVLAELRHPGIVGYVTHGRAAEGLYLAMEWLEGESLADRLGREGLTLEASVALLRRVAGAIAAAHERGIVHRDLKPSNLFLPGGRVEDAKVLDFGIARLTRLPSHTRTGAVIGTPGYMAPEQVRGANDVDARADVFSLGCVLFECVTGRPAFVGEHFIAILAKVLLEEAPSVRELNPGLPPALDALVARMLAKERSERPRDAGDVLVALDTLGSLIGDAPARSEAALPVLTMGERRPLSLVFARPASSIEISQTISAENAEAQSDRVVELARGFGARAHVLAGGAVVATLAGAGSATDQAARAARCALALRRVLPETHVGLCTGWSETSSRFPVGELIDRAARQIAGAAGVRLDEVTAGLLDMQFDVRGDEGALELVGEREVTETPRKLLGRPTPCVGRTRELTFLEGVFGECVEERAARAALVVGPAGFGKSRLRAELVSRLHAEVLIGRGDSLRAGSPFSLIAPVLRRAAGIIEGEPLAARQRKLRARIARYSSAEDRTRLTAFIGELAGVPFSADEVPELTAARRDPMVMADQTRRAWEDWIALEAGAAPLVLVLEDLHWGDLPTVQYVDAALRHAYDRPLFVLALARPEVRDLFPGLWAGRSLTALDLAPLRAQAAGQLVELALGDKATPELTARLVERAAGNALYLEELIRAAAQNRENIPDSVLAMMQARLEALSPDGRRLLRAASVFGQAFWPSAVAALLGREGETDALVRELQPLCDAELIVRKAAGRFSEPEYAFRHALLREAAYTTLTDTDRPLGHRLAGAWLERVGETEAIVLAHHHELGGDPGRAVAWCRRAAEQALAADDLVAACERAERAVQLGATGEELGAARRIEAEARQWRGDHAGAEAAGLEAMAHLPVGSPHWCRAAAEVAVAAGKMGHPDQLVGVGTALAALDGADPSLVIAMSRAGTYLLFAGKMALADVLLDRIERVDTEDTIVIAWVVRARAFRASARQDPASCLHLMQESVGWFERAGDLRSAALQQGNTGYDLTQLGQYKEARAVLEGVLVVAERMGAYHIATVARQNLGLALARLGLLDEARAIQEAAVRELAAHGDRRMESSSRTYLALVHLAAGDLDAAEREGELAVVAGAAAPGPRAEALALLAHVHLARGRTADAIAAARAGVDLIDGGGEESEPFVRAALLVALDAAADPSLPAEVEIARAGLLARADRIADPVLRRSFLEAVSENATTMRFAARFAR